jgi:hypothetical protein
MTSVSAAVIAKWHVLTTVGLNWEAFTGPNPAVRSGVNLRWPRGGVEKCSFCYQRIDRGLKLGLKPGSMRCYTRLRRGLPGRSAPVRRFK